MSGSLITLAACSILLFALLNALIWGAIFVIYYLFIKRARLYCRVKKELKCVLHERESALEQSTQK
ncbi:hypothetical protein MCU_01417 [Bartonella elizabethae Re6043vi]|uniref:Uncharacterized protein n=2 Tax=Bartonella elizabethae TaxID=807 RepID=J0R4M2_BAREL|nr:hypothetical protein [Bartonella elizabethae]EJF82535.1 hypothetical protein MCU_01417 [Bartonella elizabethae Re6043vi]EJF93511.1 hypothetical protein MEE_01457 [Bartonella elizabethae F9251 = ATCC 49927]VEJ41880.1 Uncharacterised protein [Bartonella elizabethae]